MTMKKRALSLILAAGMVASALPVSALAEAEEEGNYQLTVSLPSTQTEELGALPVGTADAEKKSIYDFSIPFQLTSEGDGVFHLFKNTETEGLDPATKKWLEENSTLSYQQFLVVHRENAASDYLKKLSEIELAVVGSDDLSDISDEQVSEIRHRASLELGDSWPRRTSGEDGPALTQEMLLHLCLVGIMEGGDASFQLDRPVTQGEFVKMTVTALGRDPEETPEGAFWAEGYVKKAVSDGWLTAAPEEFDYNKTVSWQEAEAMLARAMGRESVSDLELSRGAEVDFADQPLFRDQTAVIFCNFLAALAAEDPDQIEIELPPVQFEELSRLPGSIVETEKEKAASSAGPVPDRQGSGQSAPARETTPDGHPKIRVKPQLGAKEMILLYQEAITINHKNFQTAKWEHRFLLGSNILHSQTDPEEPDSGNSAGGRASGEDGPALTQEMLLYLCLAGVMGGGDGSFQLDRPVTQGEFVKMTAIALDQYPEETAQGAFWAEAYVKKAISAGWITDTLEEFDYNKTVSWQEAEAMLARAMGRESISDLDLSQGADVDFADQPLFRKQTAVIFCNFLAALADAENQ